MDRKFLGITFKVNAQDRPHAPPKIIGNSPEIVKARFNESLNEIRCKIFSDALLHTEWKRRHSNQTAWSTVKPSV